MMIPQLLFLVSLATSQQGAAGFSLVPTTHTRADSIQRTRGDSNLLASNSQHEEEESPQISENDMSMFLSEEDQSSETLEFFVTSDESIQRLEDVEDLFRQEHGGIMMEEQTGRVPLPSFAHPSFARREHHHDHHHDHHHHMHTNPIASDAIKMTQTTGIGIDETRVTKKVMYYEYDGTLSKIKRNMCDKPVEYYSE